MHVERSNHRRTARSRAVVTVEPVPARSSWSELWDLYHDAFEPLQELALLNHLYPRADFEALLADPAITKLVARADSRPVGSVEFPTAALFFRDGS